MRKYINKIILIINKFRFENLTICSTPYKKKQYPENFAFLEFSSYLPVKIAFLLKSTLLFNMFYCFSMFVNKHFMYLGCVYLMN